METIRIHATEPLFGIHIGEVDLQVHDAELCVGRNCCIHNPSEHSMRSFSLLWRSDTRVMERTCPHGVGHPDPDHIAFIRLARDNEAAWADSVHGCDGCCKRVKAEEYGEED